MEAMAHSQTVEGGGEEGSVTDKCLTAVGPVDSNDVALVVHVLSGGSRIPPRRRRPPVDGSKASASLASSRSVLLDVECGSQLQLAVGVATQRDFSVDGWSNVRPTRGGDDIGGGGGGEDTGHGYSSPLEAATWLAQDLMLLWEEPMREARGASDEKSDAESGRLDSGFILGADPLPFAAYNGRRYINRRYSEAMAAHRSWWAEWWGRGWVDLGGEDGEWGSMERFYVTMLYFMRISMREGAVAPALWGPFSTTDTPQASICV